MNIYGIITEYVFMKYNNQTIYYKNQIKSNKIF